MTCQQIQHTPVKHSLTDVKYSSCGQVKATMTNQNIILRDAKC